MPLLFELVGLIKIEVLKTHFFNSKFFSATKHDYSLIFIKRTWTRILSLVPLLITWTRILLIISHNIWRTWTFHQLWVVSWWLNQLYLWVFSFTKIRPLTWILRFHQISSIHLLIMSLRLRNRDGISLSLNALLFNRLINVSQRI